MVEADLQFVGERSFSLDRVPHSPHFADEVEFPTSGICCMRLIEEGKRVAAAVGVQLHEDPWAMNKIGAR